MPKKVRIPTPLRKLTNNEEMVEINAATIGEALVELQTRSPASRNASWMKKARCAASSTSMSTRKTSASYKTSRPR